MKNFKEYITETNGNPPLGLGSKKSHLLQSGLSKRTPEQEKAIREWEEKYGIFAKNRPAGKPPPRPFDPEEKPPPYIEGKEGELEGGVG